MIAGGGHTTRKQLAGVISSIGMVIGGDHRLPRTTGGTTATVMLIEPIVPDGTAIHTSLINGSRASDKHILRTAAAGVRNAVATTAAAAAVVAGAVSVITGAANVERNLRPAPCGARSVRPRSVRRQVEITGAHRATR